MGKRTKNRRAPAQKGASRGGTRSSRAQAEFIYEAKARLGEVSGDRETEIQRIHFFVDYGYLPRPNENVAELRKRYEEGCKKREERKKEVRSESQYVDWRRYEQSSGGGGCHHHCYHDRPAVIGSGFTYDDGGRSCCNCGVSAPNPYDNERR